VTIEVKQVGSVPVTTHVPAWTWRCDKCGWLGLGHTSETAALREGADHAWGDHGLAICQNIAGEIQFGHPGHLWKHVLGTDSIDQCDRCQTFLGK
jgi:hypothetical protein